MNPTHLSPFFDKHWLSKWVIVSGDWGNEVELNGFFCTVPTSINLQVSPYSLVYLRLVSSFVTVLLTLPFF